METLEDKERSWARGRGWGGAAMAVVGTVWMLAGAADWALRLSWFQWHRQVWFTPTRVRVARAERTFVTNALPEGWGGDLTRLANLPSFSAAYGAPRPGGVQVRDWEGFRNPAPPEGLVHPVVVVGDSFMAAGEPMTNMFSAQLERLSGWPVYNRALEGMGPFLSLSRYVDSEAFGARKPRLVIWGFIEREMVRHQFSGLAYQLEIREKNIRPAENLELTAEGPRVMWAELSPRRLKSRLPGTSAMAQYAQKAWNRLRYALLGMITPDVLVSTGAVEGRRILFYRPAVEVTLGDPSERNPEEIAWAVGVVRDYLAARGVELIVVLIPDKETVYRDLVPAHVLEGRAWPPSCLWALEAAIAAKGVAVVNLLPSFQERAERGELLYWPDDTHWNERGIRLAAEETWKRLAERLDHE